MLVQICQLAEDPTCSNSQQLTWNTNDHLNYFNVTSRHFLDAKCATSVPIVVSDNNYEQEISNEE